MKYAVIGAGSWGTTMASLLAVNVPTTIWARRESIAKDIDRKHRNKAYLKGYDLPPQLHATNDLSAALDGVDVIVMGVPSHGYRDVLMRATDLIANDTPIISLSKGIEAGTLMRMTEVTADVLPDHDPGVIGVLTGPNLAREIMDGQPAATVIAIPSQDVGSAVQRVIASPRFRVYTNPDVIGSEAAGAVKNVMAIAAGMASGRGYGDNTLATLVTRALVEVSRLGVAMGGDVRTFSGLAGIGDLVATCNSSQSRNHRVGFGLGQGRDLHSIIDEMNMVAEGVKSTSGVLALAKRYDIELPIAQKVGEVLYDGLDVNDALHQLMTRQMGSEFGDQ
ncbi:Glycerol-3-phosphate dehydrogenase [NAD(P)+] [hydrothermal vent metagenome]|uniref:Glycerol-3-phosphate dehydrogenase [NAD(P)+] n=1 Tax=hydrothermal vent metagenome TaxID=652676 RepID=A0A3B0SR40_9ZZZZ